MNADPPWQFEPYSRDTGMDRAADNHYPTMALGALCAMTARDAGCHGRVKERTEGRNDAMRWEHVTASTIA